MLGKEVNLSPTIAEDLECENEATPQVPGKESSKKGSKARVNQKSRKVRVCVRRPT